MSTPDNHPHETPWDQLATDMLDQALNRLPAYRAWQVLDPGPTYPVTSRYESLPHTTKADIRTHFPHGFIPPDRDLDAGLAAGQINFVQTSGTTEEQTTNLWNQSWWDASEKASWTLNSHAAAIASGHHREAILTSPRSTGFLSENGYLSMNQRRLDRFLYLNERLDVENWTPDHMTRMAHEINEFKPIVLEANPTLLARLCRHIADSGLAVTPPSLIVLSYEFPSRLYKRQFERAFPGTPVVSSYGSTECAYVFTECEEGSFHQNTDFCRIDFEPLLARHGGPETGRLLVTPFHNEWFTLIRFDIGDLGRRRQNTHCPCGRQNGLTLESMEGRIRDVTLTTDGRALTLGQLDAVMSKFDNLLMYKLEQTDITEFNVRIVTDPNSTHPALEGIESALQTLYGPGSRVQVQPVDSIPPEASGKHRLAILRFPFDYDSLFKDPDPQRNS